MLGKMRKTKGLCIEKIFLCNEGRRTELSGKYSKGEERKEKSKRKKIKE
jgi:hypothetical protein